MNLPLRSPRLFACFLGLSVTAQTGLIHRYSFKDGAAKDSVGGRLLGRRCPHRQRPVAPAER